MYDSLLFERAVRRTDNDKHIEYVPNMDEFSAGGFRPTEVPVSITPRELAIRKGLRLIKTATCSEDLYEIISLWADHDISVQVQNMDNRILALEETWARRDARLAAEAMREAARKANSRQAQYDKLYSDLFARAETAGATTMAIVMDQGDIVVAVGGVNKKHWSASNVKAMLAAETRLNGGRLEFVV